MCKQLSGVEGETTGSLTKVSMCDPPTACMFCKVFNYVIQCFILSPRSPPQQTRTCSQLTTGSVPPDWNETDWLPSKSGDRAHQPVCLRWCQLNIASPLNEQLGLGQKTFSTTAPARASVTVTNAVPGGGDSVWHRLGHRRHGWYPCGHCIHRVPGRPQQYWCWWGLDGRCAGIWWRTAATAGGAATQAHQWNGVPESRWQPKPDFWPVT